MGSSPTIRNILIVLLVSCLWNCNGNPFSVIDVGESTSIGAVIETLPPVSENFEYSLYQAGDLDGLALFTVNKKGEIILKTQLKYEIGKINYRTITVIKREKGKRYGGTAFTRQINIIDSNNHSPRFAKQIYHGSIKEGLPAGSIVSGLEDCYATDLDSSGIKDYSITAGNNNNEFMLDYKELNGIKFLIVKTTKVLDRDEIRSTPYLDLGVQANDGGIGDEQKFSKTVIRIKIEDINDNPPVFIYNNWRRSIQENSIVMSSVIKISASDNDEGQNAEVYYRFEKLNDNFYIHPSTGIISVAYPLNSRETSVYELTVIAQDKSVLAPKSSKAFVSLQVIDVPNYPIIDTSVSIAPTLLKKSYTVTIRADLPVKSFVFLASVANPEKQMGKSLKFDITGASAKYFYISPKTGVVTLKRALNRLVTTKVTYKLYISVEGEGTSTDTSVLVVNVQPLNLNMHAPVFEKNTLNIDIVESINVNTAIGYSVTAVDSDPGEDGRVTYQVVGGSGIGFFNVNKKTGVISTAVQFKNVGVYDLYIRAIDSGLYRKYSTMYVQIKVLCGSDTPPYISSAMYVTYIPENSPQGSFIGMIYARSRVPGKDVSYSLAAKDTMHGIAVDSKTGVITSTQVLDYEQEKSTFLEVVIKVHGSSKSYKTALLVNIINENDNPPVFTRPSVTVHVAENSGNLDSLVCLFATDEDGINDFPIKYTIVKGNIDNTFSIDQVTGQLSVKNLDYEKHQSYNLQVEASDGLNKAKALVNVLVTDTEDPPHFERSDFTAVLDEGSAENTVVQSLSVVSDVSGSHICSWNFEDVTPDVLELFALVTEPKACIIKVRPEGKIVWTKEKNTFKFSLRAIQKNKRNQYSTASLTVKIRDLNTNSPVFTQTSYAISIVGEQKLGKRVIAVKALDLDDSTAHGRITYDIQDGKDSNIFSIEPSGEIFLKSSMEMNKEYVVKVNARKQGSVPLLASTTVRISMLPGNAELPKFAFVDPLNKISETTSVATVAFTVDAGTSNAAYKIVGGNTGDAFAVNNYGQVLVKNALDYETVKLYKLVIRATIPSVPPRFVEKTFDVNVVDVNDNSPVFAVDRPNEEMKLFIDQYSPKGTIVGKFKAYDKDSGENGLVSYTIPGAYPFAIGQDGTITTTREINDPIGTQFQFAIVAMDNSKSTSRKTSLKIKALIKKGTKPPLFTQQVYRAQLPDNVNVGTSVTTISTSETSPMSTATFRVAGGEFQDKFCIDATKVLSVKRPLDFDMIGDTNSFNLKIEMTHNHQSTLATVLVTHKDVNDNAPVFAGPTTVMKEVKENVQPGDVLYTARAIDHDSSENGRITYSIVGVLGRRGGANVFKINPKTGELTLANKLNFEEAEEYDIIIKAQDNGATVQKYALQKVTIRVVDVNDKRPHFTELSYTGYIPTSANPGYHIMRVYAVDFDSGRFGQVTYSISGSDYDGTFSIGATSGIITLLKPIALLDQNVFKLNLIAQDIDQRGQVVVTLYAVTMDGPPNFALRKFTFNVTENNDPGKALGRVKGISLDSLRYRIVRGNTGNLFRVQPKSGIIYSTQPLDAEKGTRYILYIRATDLSERFVETSVEINVLNLNDNKPTFRAANRLIEAVIDRKIRTGEKVVNVEAFDLDVGDRLRFEIEPMLAREYFRIDSDGIIYTRKSVQKLSEGSNQFQFNVIATDLSGESGSVTVRLTLVRLIPGAIIIREINEKRRVSDGWFIRDLPREFSSSRYKIVFPSKQPFKIDQVSGMIGLKQGVDYEVRTQYYIIVEEANTEERGEYINYKVNVPVVDANDNKPYFTMKNRIGKVNKNAQPGTTVFKLTANDLDSGNAGTVVFEILDLEVPFDIDPITSEIKTTSLVTLTQDWYNITVQAYDQGIPPQVSEKAIIHIKTGDNPPEFSMPIYEFKVSENSQPGHIVGVVVARSLSGISIQYSITSGDEDNLFIIKSDGSIILQGNLDYESGKNVYRLSVQATEMSTMPLMSTVQVVVIVTNINDNPPVFREQEYRSQPVSENVPIGTTVLTVSATDCDCGQTCQCAGGDLKYVLQKFTDTFQIDDITGEIKTIRRLDYDRQSEYRFQVKVYDNDIRPQTGVADVVITLSNVNDNAPEFTPNFGTHSITENIERGTILLTVQAQDRDGDSVTYSIEEGDKENFEIGPKTGVVRITTKSAPTFMQDQFVLKIAASDGVNKGYYTLTILIEDVNDNNPVFAQCSSYRPMVKEQAPVGTSVIKVTAIDSDRGRNGEVEYEIREPQRGIGQVSTQSDFRIDNTTGLITTNRVFDREIKRSYIILVIALDGGHSRSPAERNSASCQLEIDIEDINDHKPIFSVQKYDISIAENTPIDSVVLEVSAHDKDEGKNAQIVYSIKQAKLTPEFSIDQRTGSISVAQSLIGKDNRYSFQVLATDKGDQPQSSTIEIDINVIRTNPPRFLNQVYRIRITEDTSPGTLILTVKAVSRTDSGEERKIFYSILPGNLPSTNKPASFNVDSNTGELRTGKKLDYETLREYVLTVNAVDDRGLKSNAKVFINIEDRNDNSPIFVLSKYEFGKIAEGKAPGQIVEIVNATDADSGLNGLVKYSLQKSKESDMFLIDADSGEIRTNVVFDREVTPKITFHVKAEDQAVAPEPRLSSFVYVTIQVTDVNDNQPEFTKKVYRKTIEENSDVGSNVVEIQAIDKDAGENSLLNYYIISGNEKGYFSTNAIHRASGGSIGFITVARKLDREDESDFELRIAASDSKYNAFTTAFIKVVDSNDNDPVFTKTFYNASIPENSVSGIFVLQVEATDLDTPAVQEPITYSIASGAEGYFTIDEKLGIVKTGIKMFDREKKSVYTFLVFASDGTRTGSANIRVTVSDVNDETPEFLDGPYLRTVQENQKPGAVVGYVTAKDKDEGRNRLITYSLLDDAGRFVIDPNTGLIRTKVKLDRESNDNEFVITVAATDSGKKSLQGTVKVTISVTDANDMHPYFTQNKIKAEINECTDIGHPVTKVSAKDEDAGINAEVTYSITFGNTPRRFRIDPDTGIITVAHRLDYEKEKEYKLIISVRDKGVPQLISKKNASVHILMQDCNDNSPTCQKPSYKVSIYENAPKGHEIAAVKFIDSDSGANGQFDFFIDRASEHYQFKVTGKDNDPNTAVITLDWILDREKKGEFHLLIGAKDRGIPPKIGTCPVIIKVLDINDYAPQFKPPLKCGYVNEGQSTASQKAMTVSVVDSDGDGNQCPCTFKIIDDPSNIFEIQALSSGDKAVIKSKSGVAFDREAPGKQVYPLKIAVSDGGTPKLTSETTVYIEVKDKNDNLPKDGGQLDVLFNIYDGKFVGGDIAQVYILDNDRTIGDIYTHRILAGRSNSFSINGLGMVSARKDVAPGNYKMSVASTDKKARQSVTSDITINVENILKEQIDCAVPVRLSHMRKPLTCKELNYIDFAKIFSEVFGLQSNQTVKVFSIRQIDDLTQTVDVWFYISRTQYVNGRKVESCMPRDDILILVYKYWKEIRDRVGGEIVSIGIDACAKETCPNNLFYCYNQVKPLKTYSVLSNENGAVPPPRQVKAFVSLDMEVIPRCTAMPIPRIDMSICDLLRNKNPCLNGGVCVPVMPSGYRCKCLRGFDGPQCQRTTRYVKINGYFWLPKISVFYEGSISFEFATKKGDGLLLFHGPVNTFGAKQILDFFAIDLIDGQIRLRITQGESKVFERTLVKGKRLDDGIFHHVEMYKKGTYIRLTIDYCNDIPLFYDISENKRVIPNVNRETCEISGTIPGTKRFINGIYPLQIGLVKYAQFPYKFESFEGCIRTIIENGYLYDLGTPIEEHLSGVGCNEFTVPCANGGLYAGVGAMATGCLCPFGFTGKLCRERIKSFNLARRSFFEITFLRQLKYFDRYQTNFKVELRTDMKNGMIVYEGYPQNRSTAEFMALELINGFIHYSHNLGDGILTLPIKGLDISDNRWYGIDLKRQGGSVTVQVTRNNTVVGFVYGRAIGRAHLLDTQPVVYVGAQVEYLKSGEVIITKDLEGCIKFSAYHSESLFGDKNKNVFIKKENVGDNCTCGPLPIVPCPVPLIYSCVAGVWLCGANPTTQKQTGASAMRLTQMGGIMLIILLLIFFFIVLMAAIVKKQVQTPPIVEPIYYDAEGKNNVMPYADEGAGEDDFFNYDLEKLLSHFNAGYAAESQQLLVEGCVEGSVVGIDIKDSGAAAGAEGGGVSVVYDESIMASSIVKEEVVHEAYVEQVEACVDEGVVFRDMDAEDRFKRSQVESIDVGLFIETRLAEADAESASLVKDTLLHYGYEGEDSEVEDLSELEMSDNDEYDVDDFSYVHGLGYQFHKLHIILNPPPSDEII